MSDIGIQEIGRLTKLTTLNLAYINISSVGLDAICKITDLKDLNLSVTAITDRDLKKFARLQNLRTLDLSNTQITDDGIKQISECKKLSELWINGTEVTLDGFIELKDSSQSTNVYWDNFDESNAAAKIEALGGSVRRDEQFQGRPIVAVDFIGQNKLTDKHLHLLKVNAGPDLTVNH